MTIKLVACDLDGTLMGETLTFSPRLRRAIEQANNQGIVVTIATGRGFPSTQQYAQQLGITAPVICYQGAQIKTCNGHTLYKATLSRAFLPDVISFCRAGNWELAVYYQDEIYKTTVLYEQEYYDRWFGLPMHQVDDLFSALPGDITKFLISASTKQEGDTIERQLRVLAGTHFQVMRSHNWFVEGLSPQVSKGKSVARLAKHLGIARAEVMTIGDSGNDLAMVEWAGFGVAMGNASPDVKAVADIVAPTQSEDGAAWAIEKYVLKEQEIIPLP